MEILSFFKNLTSWHSLPEFSYLIWRCLCGLQSAVGLYPKWRLYCMSVYTSEYLIFTYPMRSLFFFFFFFFFFWKFLWDVLLVVPFTLQCKNQGKSLGIIPGKRLILSDVETYHICFSSPELCSGWAVVITLCPSSVSISRLSSTISLLTL